MTATIHPPIKRIDFDDARKFVDAISPRGEFFGEETPERKWIFRGQSSDQYDLLPAAFRPASQTLLKRLSGYPDNFDLRHVIADGQTITEALVLWKLITQMNEHGLPVFDGVGLEVEHLIGHFLDPKGKPFAGQPEWPNHRIFPLFALAQHYGLPTRLLDWSRSALIAAYFAAIEPRSNAEAAAPTRAAVWAVHMAQIDKIKADLKPPGAPRPLPVFRAIGAPRASNSNLNAQDGLFTVNWWEGAWGQLALDRIPLNKLVETIAPNHDTLAVAPLLYCFTFPRRKAGEVLWWLAKERITAAKLFPDVYGVVKSMKEELTWDSPFHFG